MSNFAALIDVLTIAGSRLSDGEPNSSGTVYFFQPGGNTPVNVYSDAAATTIVTQPLVLTSGGLVNIATVPNGLYVTQPVRVLIQDVNTNTVADTVYVPATAGDVGVDNDGFTDSTMDGVLDKAFTSFGGQDWRYQIANGQTPRYYHDVITEQSISVKAFGAVGDGVASDTTAIQAALNFAKSEGGGIVLFPPGEYLIDQALTISSVNGVSIQGAGVDGTTIVTSNTGANVFTFATCEGFTISGMTITATGTNSASAISIATGDTIALRNVLVDASGGGTFLIPVAVTTTGVLIIEDCRLTAKAADATARALKLTGTNGVNIRGGFFNGEAGAAMEFATTTSNVTVISAGFGRVGANIGILWTSGMTGTDFVVVGCNLRTGFGTLSTAFDWSGLSANPRLYQWGNYVDGYVETTATGGAGVTPDLSRGSEISIIANSGGAGAVSVFAPIPTPSTVMRNTRLTLKLGNAAGGAVTWSMSGAVYKLVGGTAPSGTDGTTTIVEFLRDVDVPIWREVCRASTTT